jgi:CHASE3 domain sensor protein
VRNLDEITTNQKYVELVKEWINEQNIRIEDCSNTITTAEKIIESNKKQIELKKELLNSAIIDFNIWAVENGFEKVELL